MCSLCFSEIRGLVAPASPPPLQCPPSESWGGVLEAAPHCRPLRSQSPVLVLLVTLRKDSCRPARDQGHRHPGPGAWLCQASRACPSPGHGVLAPHPCPPEEALGSVCTLPSGALGVTSEAPGGFPCSQMPVNLLSSPRCFSLVLSEVLICPLLHHSCPSVSCLPSGVSDQICGRNSFCLPGPSSDPRAVPIGCGHLISSPPALQAPASLVTAPGPATLCPEARQRLPPQPHFAPRVLHLVSEEEAA